MPDDPRRPPKPDDPEATELAPTTLGQAAGPPHFIGPYRLLQKIGEGGMGEVWQAEQSDPIRRKVALKLIKAGMDTKQFVARFEAERQAIALMDHPCIAKIFDAGASPRGLPYFVMEYVQGEPITRYCDRQRLSIRERLDLFALVCEAVQHAHQKGIIHRDLKPSNILVTIQGNRPVPKIIDFGVAKATAQRLTEKSMYTELGVLIGTPEYMSPEQAEMTGLDVDTRTDVYALGVTLYELLTGTLPFAPEELRAAGFDEIRRRIREVDPPRPSTKVKGQGDASIESARRRCTEPGKLVGRLKGDLDWITMKAIEKDRTRRYSSPNELAADVARHLHAEPVLAGPPSATYRAGKFVRRHRMGVGVAATGVLALMVFSGAMAWQVARTARERDRANREAQTANRALEFLRTLFEVSDPSEARGSTVTAREILDRGSGKIDAELAGEPVIRAKLLLTLGVVYQSLGLYDSAKPLIERSLSLRREALGSDHPDTLESIDGLSLLLQAQGKLKEAEPYAREAMEGHRRVLGDDHPETLTSINNMGLLLQADGKYRDAEPYYREALEGYRRVLGNDHRDTLSGINNMGFLLKVEGRVQEAEPYYREALEGSRRVFGNDHPDTLGSINNMGALLQAQGKLKESAPFRREALEGYRRVLGNDHRDTLSAINNMGFLLLAQNKLEEAEPYYLEALEGRRRVLGKDHPDTLTSINNMGFLLQTQGKLKEAGPYYRVALEGRRRVRGNDHPDTVATLINTGSLLQEQGEFEEAESYDREALETSRHALGNDHPMTLSSMANLGDLYTSQGRLGDAERLLGEAVAGARRAMPAGHRILGRALSNYGRCLSGLKRYAEAETALVEAHGIMATADAAFAHKPAQNLVDLYEGWGKPDKAAEWGAKLKR
jgi:non-specific serine/threonine protein kinase/serine/threonine-protein kinase